MAARTWAAIFANKCITNAVVSYGQTIKIFPRN